MTKDITHLGDAQVLRRDSSCPCGSSHPGLSCISLAAAALGWLPRGRACGRGVSAGPSGRRCGLCVRHGGVTRGRGQITLRGGFDRFDLAVSRRSSPRFCLARLAGDGRLWRLGRGLQDPGRWDAWFTCAIERSAGRWPARRRWVSSRLLRLAPGETAVAATVAAMSRRIRRHRSHVRYVFALRRNGRWSGGAGFLADRYRLSAVLRSGRRGPRARLSRHLAVDAAPLLCSGAGGSAMVPACTKSSDAWRPISGSERPASRREPFVRKGPHRDA